MDACAAAEDYGVDLSNFPDHVAHQLHSIHLEDIRYFFDKDFSEFNSVPTVNSNLSSDENILLRVPAHHSPYKFPAGAAFDLILSNNDDAMNFLKKGSSTLEKLSHSMHMMEMWNKASQTYKEITLSETEAQAICPCLTDEKLKEIISELDKISIVNKVYLPPVKGKKVGDKYVALDSVDRSKRSSPVMLVNLRGKQDISKRSSPGMLVNLRGKQDISKRSAPDMLVNLRGKQDISKRSSPDMLVNLRGKQDISKRSAPDMLVNLRGKQDISKRSLDEEVLPIENDTRMNNDIWFTAPYLKDSESWAFFKKIIDPPTVHEAMAFNFALYMHCQVMYESDNLNM